MKRTDFIRGLIHEMASTRGDCSAGSFMNCHAIGLHSIVLRESPMVRMFVTTPDHELWRRDDRGVPATIAFHSHRSDLALETVRGRWWNWTAGSRVTDDRPIVLNRFRWSSAINGGTDTFEAMDHPRKLFYEVEYLPPGKMTSMRSDEIHTVEVSRGERAAWLVAEGRDDPGYDAVSYSAQDLTKFVPVDLYRPMTFGEATELLAWVTGKG